MVGNVKRLALFQITNQTSGDLTDGFPHQALSKLTHNSVPHDLLLVGKDSLPSARDPGERLHSYIDDGRRMTLEMVHFESRGHGDRDNALRRLATRHGLPYKLLWNFLYKPPKGVFWDLFERLRAAYKSECTRRAKILARQIDLDRVSVVISDDDDRVLHDSDQAFG